MLDTIDKIAEQLGKLRTAGTKIRKFYLVVPYSETPKKGRTKEYVTHECIRAENVEEAKANAYRDTWDSCFSAKLRGEIFAYSVYLSKIRAATPAERKKLFFRKENEF